MLVLIRFALTYPPRAAPWRPLEATRRLARIVALWLVVVGSMTPAAAQRGASRVRPALQRQIHEALDRGRGYLERVGDGSGSARARTAAGTRESGLLLYAALHVGVDREAPWMRAALRDLSRRKQAGTYQTACAILALAKADPEAYAGKVQALADQLAGWQARTGGWGYPSGEDLSNTQYAALGLWTAERAGAEIDPAVWSRLADALPSFTDPYGGFRYRRGPADPTLSMTAAGAACASICLERLGATPEGQELLTAARARSLRLIEARSLAWLADHYRPGSNPGRRDAATWWLYALYGVERAAALTGAIRLGVHDWYAEGALHLVGTQNPDGTWHGSSGTTAATSFALLFLQRATARSKGLVVSGPRSEAPDPGAEARRRRDLGRNRMAQSKPTAAATSESASHAAAFAVDGDFGTDWRPGDEDGAPALTLEFARPHSIDTILVSRGRMQAPGSGESPAAGEVLLLINGVRIHALTVPGDPERKARLELREPVELERLELRIRPRAADGGKDAPPPASIGEVEIQTRPK